jgi:hypothetical protein
MQRRASGITAVTLGLFLWGGARLEAQRAQDLWQIVPGTRAGAITAKTTLAGLERLYGKGNVREQKIDVGEGQQAPGAVVFPGDPARRLEILWREGGRTPAAVRVRGTRSRWKTPQGILLGTSLKELERLNGKPFRLYGFSWDYGGLVESWQKGRLAGLESKMSLILSPGEKTGVSEKEYQKVMGDRPFSSAHPVMRKMNPRVVEINIRLD